MNTIVNFNYNFGIRIPKVKKVNRLEFYQKVNNKELYNAIVLWQNKNKASKRYIPITPFIQKSIWIIANKYSFDRKFINYPFRQDMVSEATIICLKYMGTFNPEKTKSAYSYFNQAIHNCFLQYIIKEKKQISIKETCLQMEIDRCSGYGKKVGESKKDYEEKIWD